MEEDGEELGNRGKRLLEPTRLIDDGDGGVCLPAEREGHEVTPSSRWSALSVLGLTCTQATSRRRKVATAQRGRAETRS